MHGRLTCGARPMRSTTVRICRSPRASSSRYDLHQLRDDSGLPRGEAGGMVVLFGELQTGGRTSGCALWTGRRGGDTGERARVTAPFDPADAGAALRRRAEAKN